MYATGYISNGAIHDLVIERFLSLYHATVAASLVSTKSLWLVQRWSGGPLGVTYGSPRRRWECRFLEVKQTKNGGKRSLAPQTQCHVSGHKPASKNPKCYISVNPSYFDAKLAETLAFRRPVSAETAPENRFMLAYDEIITFRGAAFHELKPIQW